jgi:hypothetical protein
LLSLVRSGNMEMVKEFLEGPDGPKLVRAKNYYGKSSSIALISTNKSMAIDKRELNRKANNRQFRKQNQD